MHWNTYSRWLAAFLGATGFGLLIATQNYYTLARAGRPVGWWMLAASELPVWYMWVAMSPAIMALTHRFPPAGRQQLRNILLHVAAALITTFIMIIVVTAIRIQMGSELVPPSLTWWEAVRRGFMNSFVIFLPIYGIIVAALMAFRLYTDTRQREMRESYLEAALAQTRLDSLRAQIHPHFLFNTLHAISALMGEDVVAARKMMRRLSELLRLSLEEGAHEVPLREELHLLEQYVEIQKIRFGERLEVSYDIAEEARAVLVPRLLLQPLVENAIKHGTEHDSGPAVIQVAARTDMRCLTIVVRDNGRGFRDTGTGIVFGVGLRNTQARLEHLYHDAYSLRLFNDTGGGAVVEIETPLPARESPAGSGYHDR